MLSGCFGQEEVLHELEEVPEDAYDQEETDIYVFSDDEHHQKKIDSCPYFSDYATVTNETYFSATHIRPSSGLNDNNQYEIYEPESVEGKFVITYIDLREIYENGGNEIYFDPYFQFFESEGAAGIIFSKVADWENELNSCDDIVYYLGDSEGTQFVMECQQSTVLRAIS